MTKRSKSPKDQKPFKEPLFKKQKKTGSMAREKTLEVELHERRLDSLARLLEGDGVCVAVCFDDNKILIASNKLRKLQSTNPNTNEYVQHIKNVMTHFSRVAKADQLSDSNEGSRLEVFQAICRRYIKSQLKTNYVANTHNQAVDQLAKKILSLRDPRRAKNWSIKQAAEIAGIESDDQINGQLLGAAMISIARLATDFIKIERSIKGENPEKKFSDELLEAFRSGEIADQRNKKADKQTGFTIIRHDGENVHAEMRLIQYLLSKKMKSKKGSKKNTKYQTTQDNSAGSKILYLGISKLCCLDCSLIVQAVNESQALRITEVNDSKDTTTNITKLKTRGGHGLSTNYVLPQFIKEESQNSEVQSIKRIYKKLKDEIKQEPTPASHKMIASDSSQLSNGQTSDSEKSINSILKSSSKINLELILKLIQKGVEASSFSIENLIKQLLDGLVSKQKKGIKNRIDVHAIDNASNQYSNCSYQYQGTDIELIGRNIITNQNGVSFAGALGEGNSAHGIDASARLLQVINQIVSGQKIVGIYNTGHNHWIAFSIQLNVDKQSLNIYYKDSYGKERNDLVESVKKAFGDDIHLNVMCIQPGIKEQQDGVSCGLYALQNMQRLANHTYEVNPNLDLIKFYNPDKEELRVQRINYAATYLQESYNDIKSAKEEYLKQIQAKNLIYPKVKLIASFLRSNLTNDEEIEVRPLNSKETISLNDQLTKPIISVEVKRDVESGHYYYSIGLSEAISEEKRTELVKKIVTALNLNELKPDIHNKIINIQQPELEKFFLIHSIASNPENDKKTKDDIDIDETNDVVIDEPILNKELKDALNIEEPITKELSERLVQMGFGELYEVDEFDIMKSKSILLNLLKNHDKESIKNIKESIVLLLKEDKSELSFDQFVTLNQEIAKIDPSSTLNDFTMKNEATGQQIFKKGAIEALKLLFEDSEIASILAGDSPFIIESPNSAEAGDSERGSDPNDSMDADEDSYNLRRSEKTSLQDPKNSHSFNLQAILKKLINIDLFNQFLDESNNQALDNRVQSTNRNQCTLSNPTVTLIPEFNHIKDHRLNNQEIIHQIAANKFTASDVICMERKQVGVNMGMQDMILLANIIRYNEKSPNKIILPEKIMKAPIYSDAAFIYSDAALYKIAREKGILVVGVEGSKLGYNKENQKLYNIDREEYIIEKIADLNKAGKNVLLILGSSHISSIRDRLISQNIQTNQLDINKPSSYVQMDDKQCDRNFTNNSKL